MADESPVDAYLATLPADQRAKRCSGCAPRLPDWSRTAVELISYGMPAFRLNGRFLVSFAGWKAHCSIYPLTHTFLAAHADALDGYGRTKGSLHFTPRAPLPDALVESLIRDRVADLERDGA